jgi:hypothetical protein
VDTLRPDSLNWAVTHLLRYGDTDVLPVPFEFQAVRTNLADVIDHLGALDLERHQTRAYVRVLTPKYPVGFRVISQLDPIDTIIYTAAAYEASAAVEAFRASRDLRIACSNRLAPQPDGTLFLADAGWRDFHERSDELVQRGAASHVVCADIADFYNNAYHHRIQNALEAAGVPSARAANIEHLLSSLTAGTSRGIPVGPVGSAVLAEACLADVDAFLQRRKYIHTRFVDDFRIFVPNHAAALKALHDLTEYLYNTHRLSLQGAKTKIRTLEEFRRVELHDPGEIEEASRRRRLVDAALELTGYAMPFDELREIGIPPEMDFQAVAEVLSELYEEATRASLKVGLARHSLRRAMALRVRTLVPRVLETLPEALPVLPDVVNYLVRVVNRTNADAIGRSLRALVEGSDYRELPIVRIWCLHAFATAPQLCEPGAAFAIAEASSDPVTAGRYGALLAKAHRTIDWVRERKETWANTPPPVQRAIVASASVLPPDERRAWLGGPANSPDPLVRWVARWAGA